MLAAPAGRPYLLAIAVLVVLILLSRRLGALFFLAAFPATLAHELAHLLVGLVTWGRPSGMRLWPQRSARGYVLGSVSCLNVRWYNGLLIGLAPLLLLPLALALLYWRLQPPLLPLADEALWIYMIACLVCASLPSRQDLRVAAASSWLVLLLAAAALLALRAGWLNSLLR